MAFNTQYQPYDPRYYQRPTTGTRTVNSSPGQTTPRGTNLQPSASNINLGSNIPSTNQSFANQQALTSQLSGIRFTPRQFRPNAGVQGILGQIQQFQNSPQQQISTQEDPRLTQLTSQLTGRVQNTQQQIQQALQRVQAQAANEAEIRQQIADLAAGRVNPEVDVESDAEAAAFRVARERQRRQSRSELAERAAATGSLNTGDFDTDVSQLSNEAGFDIASFEAQLANRRRAEVIAQMLQGAQLGLSDIGQQRQTQLSTLGGLQNQLANTQSSLLGTFDRSRADRERQIAEASQGRNSQLQALQTALQGALGLRSQQFNEFQGLEEGRLQSVGLERSNILDQLSQMNTSASRMDQLRQQAFSNALQERLNLAQSSRAERALMDQLRSSALGRSQTRLQNEMMQRSMPSRWSR